MSHSTFSPKTEHNGYLVTPSQAIPMTQHTTLAIMELLQSAKYTYALFQILRMEQGAKIYYKTNTFQ
jgi:hypothetical protein